MVKASWKHDIFLGRRAQDSLVDGRSDLEIHPLSQYQYPMFHVVPGKSLQLAIEPERAQLDGLNRM
jgi:hypothetical protein